MTTEEPNTPDQPNDPTDSSDPAASSDPATLADDRFIHGLLGYIHAETDETCDARVERAMKSIRSAPRGTHARHRRLLSKMVPLATVAMLALLTVSLLIMSPRPAASAMVEAAIEATRAAPGLSYEILAAGREPDDDAHPDESHVIGTLDMRGPFMRVRISTPSGDDFVMGRDAEGEWSLRRDGSVSRDNARRAAPRWIDLGESTVLIGSLDELLAQLRDDFAIETTARDTAGGTQQITASRRAAPGVPGPDTVFVWIDPDSALVERLEMHWPASDHPEPGPAPRPREDALRPDGRGPPSSGDLPPPRRGHPQLIEGRPGFGQGLHPAPPSAIIFQRVRTVDLTDEQFSPPTP